jgi:predicted Zn-dependent protease
LDEGGRRITTGVALLAGGRIDDAIAILSLNVEEHPGSWNAYDRPGEASGPAGQRELAIANYSKSPQLNPAITNAIRMLERL